MVSVTSKVLDPCCLLFMTIKVLVASTSISPQQISAVVTVVSLYLFKKPTFNSEIINTILALSLL